MARSSLLACVGVAAVLLVPSAQAAPGDLDPSFGSGGKVLTDLDSSVDIARAVALQPNGKIVAAGYSAFGGGNFDFALVRYHADGSLDPSFGSGGKVVTDLGSSSVDEAWAMAVQPNGKIVAAGRSTTGGTLDFALVRYDRGGSLDPSFGAGGKVLTDLGNSRFDEALDVALQPNGKVVAAGRSIASGRFDFALARYDDDGSLDPSFGSGGKVLTDVDSRFDEANAVALEPNGKIVAAGLSNTGDSLDFALVRYNDDGSLDPSFGSGGKVLTDLGGSTFEAALALALRANGQILAAGVSNASGSLDFALVRYLGR